MPGNGTMGLQASTWWWIVAAVVVLAAVWWWTSTNRQRAGQGGARGEKQRPEGGDGQS
ncbi:MAG: hypothetical protein IRY95_09825 [Clostridia bacterium]|nr:hypothetical protein [Clostridia bacterium]